MYITVNGSTYENVRRVELRGVREVCYIGQSLNGLEAATGEIGVYRDDGFLLLTENTEAYSRVNLLDGMFVLTDREEAAYVPPADGDELTDSEALGILVGGAV